jgi:hypothetical protein
VSEFEALLSLLLAAVAVLLDAAFDASPRDLSNTLTSMMTPYMLHLFRVGLRQRGRALVF